MTTTMNDDSTTTHNNNKTLHLLVDPVHSALVNGLDGYLKVKKSRIKLYYSAL